ncbi:MAG TPA: hypothetical protein VF342_07350 [Alphaproteobacteria bacterium]
MSRDIVDIAPEHAPRRPTRASRGASRNNKFRGNIFVANLPAGLTDQQLAELFDDHGVVLGAFLARDPITRATKTYGLVDLAPAKAAARAVEAVNGTKVGGRRIEARMADPKMSLTIPPPEGGEAALTQPVESSPVPRAVQATRTFQVVRAASTPRTFQVEYRSIARRR